MAQTTEALPARVLGAFGCYAYGGTANLFAGDTATLQKLETGGLTWADVTRVSGGAYAAVDRWSFAQFGDRILAADGVDAMQSFIMGSSTNFADLGGSSPIARYLATVRGFVIAAAISGSLQRVQWPALEDPTDWVVSATTLADYQDIPAGGTITGIVGGEFGTIFQRRSIKRMTFVGPPLIFQFDEVLPDIGCMAPGSIVAYAGDCIFLSDDGFQMLRAMSQLATIGDQKVNKTFFADFDANYPERVTATYDPATQLYFVAYPGDGHSGGTPNKGLIYNKRLNKFSHFEQELESLFAAVQASSAYTLDTLDSVSTSIDALAASLDSPLWTGENRPFLAAFTTAHKLGLFSGSPLAATMETAEEQLISGRRATVNSLRPLGDAAAIKAQIGTRNMQNEAVVWGDVSEQNEYGVCPVLADSRYTRARLMIEAGVEWEKMLGIDELGITAGGVA